MLGIWYLYGEYRVSIPSDLYVSRPFYLKLQNKSPVSNKTDFLSIITKKNYQNFF